MRGLKIVLGVLGVLILGGLAAGSLLPKDYYVERSIEIAAPPEVVFAQVNDLKRWDAWSPWLARDKTIQNRYSGAESGVGAKVSWTSERSGEGSQTIVKSEPPRHIETLLDFGEQGSAKAAFRFEPAGEGTKVTWSMRGEIDNLLGGLLASRMDGWIGPDYEDGLARLKKHAESLPTPPPEAELAAAAAEATPGAAAGQGDGDGAGQGGGDEAAPPAQAAPAAPAGE